MNWYTAPVDESCSAASNAAPAPSQAHTEGGAR
jgi:hypothetical protein